MPQIFPNRLKQSISELETDIKGLEAKVLSLKLQCERNENKVPNVTKPQKRVEKRVPKLPAKVSNKSEVSLRASSCCCCSKKKTDCDRSDRLDTVRCRTEEKIVANIIGKNHVHQKIRIPTGRTWKELLEQAKNKPQQKVERKPKSDVGLSVMQKAVREAQTEKEEAQRRAAMLALTLDKMQALLEAQVGCDRLKEDRIAAARRSIEVQLDVERRNTSMMQIEAALQRIHAGESSSSDSVDEPVYTVSISSSRRLRHSSPTPSKISLADVADDWNDVSSIPEYSFMTL